MVVRGDTNKLGISVLVTVANRVDQLSLIHACLDDRNGEGRH